MLYWIVRNAIGDYVGALKAAARAFRGELDAARSARACAEEHYDREAKLSGKEIQENPQHPGPGEYRGNPHAQRLEPEDGSPRRRY